MEGEATLIIDRNEYHYLRRDTVATWFASTIGTIGSETRRQKRRLQIGVYKRLVAQIF